MKTKTSNLSLSPVSLLLALTALAIAGCATEAERQAAATREKAIAMIKRDFQAKGIASVERLNEDPVQAICNKTGNTPSPDVAAPLMKEMLTKVPLPADGQFLGDWKAGEKLAQSGRGFTWSDKPDDPAGGNCYNCHQMSPKELSYGTVGPSLYRFGKLRGNGPDVQKYVFSKIHNAKAFNLCSEMPRFGHIGALKEAQIKDLVALLLDPESPVNQ